MYFFIILRPFLSLETLRKWRSIKENNTFLSFNIFFHLFIILCQCVQNAYTVRKTDGQVDFLPFLFISSTNNRNSDIHTSSQSY